MEEQTINFDYVECTLQLGSSDIWMFYLKIIKPCNELNLRFFPLRIDIEENKKWIPIQKDKKWVSESFDHITINIPQELHSFPIKLRIILPIRPRVLGSAKILHIPKSWFLADNTKVIFPESTYTNHPVFTDSQEVIPSKSSEVFGIEYGEPPTYEIKESLWFLLEGKTEFKQVRFMMPIFLPYYQEVSPIQSSFPFRISNVGVNRLAIIQFHRMPERGQRDIQYQFTIKPLGHNPPTDWGKGKDIPLKDIQRFCGPSSLWEVCTPEIEELGEQFTEIVDKSVFDGSLSIYKYVRNRITYRKHLTERLGALRAFRRREGDCDEFTDLFIAIARASRLPARRITGKFVQLNGKKLEASDHAWAEVLVPTTNSWVPVDVALDFFGYTGAQHLVHKIEDTVSKRKDFHISYKSRKKGQIRTEVHNSTIRIVSEK